MIWHGSSSKQVLSNGIKRRTQMKLNDERTITMNRDEIVQASKLNLIEDVPESWPLFASHGLNIVFEGGLLSCERMHQITQTPIADLGQKAPSEHPNPYIRLARHSHAIGDLKLKVEHLTNTA